MSYKTGVLENENSESLPHTPLITPSPPKSQSTPSPDIRPRPGKKRTITELRTKEDLSPVLKNARSVKLMKKVCDAEGKSIGSVLGECSLLTKKVGQDGRDYFGNVMEKGGTGKRNFKWRSLNLFLKRCGRTSFGP